MAKKGMQPPLEVRPGLREEQQEEERWGGR